MNENIPPQAVSIVLQYGLAGVVILALGWISYRLWNRLDQAHVQFQTRIDAIQETRIAEARKEVEAKLALAASLEAMAEANKLIGEKYSALREELTLLRSARAQ